MNTSAAHIPETHRGAGSLARVAMTLAVLLLAFGLAQVPIASNAPAFAQTTLKAQSDDGDLLVVDDAAESATETATAPATKPTVKVRARVQNKGWLKTVAAGKTAGTKTLKGLRAFRVKLADLGTLAGHVKYRTYDMGKGWGAIHKDGASSGRASRAVRAVKIWLTGNVSKQYDVRYRVYIKGKGWQPWRKNKQKAGITTGGYYVSAIQVKLVAVSRLSGIDISSWQQGLNPKKVDADFIIVKSTEGTWYTNPYFKKWADATLASGKLLGSYHFARPGDATKQADYFVKAVGPYVGKCALFLDWEDNALGLGTAWAKKFMDRVYKKTGVKPLIYMSKSVCRQYNWSKVAKTYQLWVAQYLYKYYTNGTKYVTNPDTDSLGYGAWKSPTIYQYSSRGRVSGYTGDLDVNVFYGNVAAWQKMAAKS